MQTDKLTFPPDELEANRAGHMTPHQARSLRRGLGHYQGTLIFLLVFFVWVPFLSREWVTSCLTGSVCLVAAAFLVESQWVLWRDAGDGTVSQVSGDVLLVSSGGKGSTLYEITIRDTTNQNQIVKATRRQARQFKVRKHYRIFYAPRTRILMSAEDIKSRDG